MWRQILDFIGWNSKCAVARGARLLRDNLSPEQLAAYRKGGSFDVIGGDTGRRYSIRPACLIHSNDKSPEPMRLRCAVVALRGQHDGRSRERFFRMLAILQARPFSGIVQANNKGREARWTIRISTPSTPKHSSGCCMTDGLSA